MLVRLTLHQLDPVVDQVRVEVLDLLLRELDILEPGCDLVVVEDAFLDAFLDEYLQLLDVRKRDVDGQQRRLPPGFTRWTGSRSTSERKRAGHPTPPGSPSRRPDITEVRAKGKSDFFRRLEPRRRPHLDCSGSG